MQRAWGHAHKNCSSNGGLTPAGFGERRSNGTSELFVLARKRTI
nr:MAG TPA: hypothetical protein [Caudoviricetes sp.]